MENKDTTSKIKAKINTLPLVDVAVFEIISLLDSPEADFEQVVEKLSPEIAAKFLNMANSAFYGREIRSINYAVKVLGFSTMKQILITSILIDHFAKRSDLVNFDFDKFQNQAHFCAAVSRVFGEMLNYEKLEDLFTVAMLQNIGKLVIVVYFEDEHKEIEALKKAEGVPSLEAEQRLLGLTHAEIGAIVLEKLKIPQDICDAVRYHDTQDRLVSEKSNFQLELISMESARITDNFALSDKIDPLEIINLLGETIKNGQEMCQEKLRMEMRSKGYREVLGSLLKQASELVNRDLKKDLQKRTPQMGAEKSHNID